MPADEPVRAGRLSEGLLEVRRLGRTRFEDVHALQHELVELRADDAIGDVVLLTEHEPVITLGRGAQAGPARATSRAPSQAPGAASGVSTPRSLAGAGADLGVPVIEVERGGDATYHGPGQLVVYPIFRLADGRRDLHRYLRDLEEVVIRVLGELELEGERREGYTGVWLGEKKVCSIGVAVRRWVTYHGFALNLHTDLAAFRRFRPCGLDPDVMTRVADHVELPPTTLLGEVLVVKHLCRVFELELPPQPPPTPREPEGPGFFPLPILPS